MWFKIKLNAVAKNILKVFVVMQRKLIYVFLALTYATI